MVISQQYPRITDQTVQPSLWRLFFGVLTVLAVCLGWVFVVVWLVTRQGTATGNMAGGIAQTPAQSLIFLTMIMGLGVGTLIAARFWQHRGLRSLIGHGPKTLRHFAVAALVTWAIAGALAALRLPFAEPIILNMDVRTWAMWLPLGLLAVALQTGSEEILFRGYLQSQLAARFRHPAIWLVIPAILFGAAHFLPTLPLGIGLTYVAVATLFGLLAGDLTAKTGSIGAAWGLHFANNALAILVVASEGTITGLGLYRSGDITDTLTPSALMMFDLAALILVWILIRRIVTR